MSGISVTDIKDMEVVDTVSLQSTGTVPYHTTQVVSTHSNGNRVVLTGGLRNPATRARQGDRIVISGSAASGAHTIMEVENDTVLCTNESIADATGGTIAFYRKSGTALIGIDITRVSNSSAITLEDLLNDLSSVVAINTASGPSINGSYFEVVGGVFPTSKTWYTDVTKTQKISELLISRNVQKMPTVEQIRIYNADGVTLQRTITDTITYSNNVFEASRTRTVN